MRAKIFLAVLVLLALAVPAAPVHAGGVVSLCDEAHLRSALAGGGAVTFGCSGTITLQSTITIAAYTTIDGSGQDVTLSGNQASEQQHLLRQSRSLWRWHLRPGPTDREQQHFLRQ